MPSASYFENGMHDNLVDEKGNHEDIVKFASRADIIVCCLSMNSETVLVFSLALQLHVIFAINFFSLSKTKSSISIYRCVV